MTGTPGGASAKDDSPAEIAALRARILGIRQARGYLLPHHGAMAVAMPDLQDAYMAMYRSLTLSRRHLGDFEREVIWLAILIAAREEIGTHHVDLFLRAGGTAEQVHHLTRLCALALGADSYQFMDEAWSGIFPGLTGDATYRGDLADLARQGSLAPELVHLALAALQAARGHEWGVRAHIAALYAVPRPPEDALAEALSLVIWPTGVNRFLEACGVWLAMMRDGSVDPSPRYRLWADTPEQSGHDAAGLVADP